MNNRGPICIHEKGEPETGRPLFVAWRNEIAGPLKAEATSRGRVATFDEAGEFAWHERNSHKTVAVARSLFIRCGLCDEVIAVDGALPRATGRVKLMGDQLG